MTVEYCFIVVDPWHGHVALVLPTLTSQVRVMLAGGEILTLQTSQIVRTEKKFTGLSQAIYNLRVSKAELEQLRHVGEGASKLKIDPMITTRMIKLDALITFSRYDIQQHIDAHWLMEADLNIKHH